MGILLIAFSLTLLFSLAPVLRVVEKSSGVFYMFLQQRLSIEGPVIEKESHVLLKMSPISARPSDVAKILF